MFNFTDPFEGVNGTVIFESGKSEFVNIQPTESPNSLEVVYMYRFPWKRNINIKILVCAFDAQGLNQDEFNTISSEIPASLLEGELPPKIFTWNYIKMIEKYDVSYVVCRDQTVYLKFSDDPKFQRVFNGGNVAVFQVIK